MTVSDYRLWFYHRVLKWVWGLWLGFRLIAMTGAILITVPNATLMGAILWQLLVIMPLFFCTPSVLVAKNAYALIVISLVVMAYWGAAASFLLIKLYEKAPNLVSAIYGVEAIIIGVVFFVLLKLIKTLPAIHKQSRQ